MSILTGSKIKQIKDQIFKSGFQEDCLEDSSYSLRVGDSLIVVDGVEYNKDRNPYPYNDYHGKLVLPARKITVLSTIEVLKLGEGFVGKVGITYSIASKGIIPLFGPQIEPGYEGRFIATLYNVSNKDIMIDAGEKILKLEIHTLEGSIKLKTYSQQTFVNPEITGADLLMDFREELVELKNTQNKLESKINRVEKENQSIGAGYRQIVLFGVFLISASVFGVVLTILLTATSYENFLKLIEPSTALIFLIIIIITFIGGWVFTIYNLNKMMLGRMKND